MRKRGRAGRARSRRGQHRQSKGSEGRSRKHAPAKAFHALPGSKQAARNDAAVVDQGRERGRQKLLADVQKRRNARPGQEKDLCRQNDTQKK